MEVSNATGSGAIAGQTCRVSSSGNGSSAAGVSRQPPIT